MNKAQRQLKTFAVDTTSVDRVVCHGDGTVELRRHFFYHHGMTPESWGNEVLDWLPEEWALVSTNEVWQAWPKDSWFVATVREHATETKRREGYAVRINHSMTDEEYDHYSEIDAILAGVR